MSSGVEGGKLKAKTVKIAVGVAVPVCVIMIAVFVACCRWKLNGTRRDKKEMRASPNRGEVQSQVPGNGPRVPESSPVLANFFGGQRVQPVLQTYPPPPYLGGHEEVGKQGMDGGTDERTRHLSALEAEQVRIQTEIQRLRNGP